jgi:PAS domain S-box-containing protein
MFVALDTEGQVTLINKRGCKVLGYDEPDVLGKNWFDNFVPEGTRAEAKGVYERLMAGEMRPVEYFENTVLTNSGEERLIAWHNTVLTDENGEVTGTLSSGEDITDRKLAEEKLLHYQGRLKSLASELTLTEERLRRSIAADLHDMISQSLAMSKAKMGALSESVSDEQTKSVLAEISDSLGETLGQSRSLTSRLSYPTLGLLGLGKAVAKWLADEVQAKHGIETEFEDDEQAGSLNEDVQAVLFRGVRELLTNVIKHADANNVRVSIQRAEDQVRVCVEDDGRGFCPPEPGEAGGGYGMLSVREALERLGGRLETESRPGRGCRATMIAPSRVRAQT